MTHTPGPWTYVESPDCAGDFQIGPHPGWAGGTVAESTTTVDDARLIAAAPEMLAELHSLRELLERTALAAEMKGQSAGPAYRRLETLLAVIAKASVL